MIIEKFRVENYKSIKECDFVNLEKDITLFVGKNEAGKTSILKALESFSSDYVYDKEDLSLHSDAKKEYDEGNLDEEDIPMTTIYFQIEEEDRSELEKINPEFKDIDNIKCTKYYDEHYEIEIPELDIKFKGNIDDKTKEEEISSCISKINQLAESFKEELDSILSDTPYMSFKEDYVEVLDKIISFNEFREIDELDYNKLRNIVTDNEEILGHIDKLIGKIETYKRRIKELNRESDGTLDQILNILPNFMYFSSVEELEDEVNWTELKLNKEKHKTLRNLLELSDLNFEDEADLEDRDVLTEVVNGSAKITGLLNESWTQEELKLYIYVTNSKIMVSIYDDVVKKYYNPSARSQGFQWFLSFYINFTAGSKNEFENTIILLDDPGVYLHASGQKDLIKTLEKISRSNQVVLSTHSPFMIDTDRLERIRIVSKLESEGTIINEKFYKSDFDAFAPIRASIGMNLGDSLFFNQKTIIVEGITDDIFLRTMSELLTKQEENYINTSQIAILPINSADRAKYFIPFLLNEKMDFVVLLDFDEKGKKKKKELTENFGDDLKIITYDQLKDMKTGDLEIEDLIDFPFYLKAVNNFYKDLFEEKLGKESLDETELEKKSFKGIKKYFKLSELKRLDKVAVAKEIAEMMKRGEIPDKKTINNFSELFKLINENFGTYTDEKEGETPTSGPFKESGTGAYPEFRVLAEKPKE
jgi:predicted ATP-dependent endonuclease of OLD family